MEEVPVHFGIDGCMQGYFTVPDAPGKPPETGILLLSGGDLPNLGPNRLYVECAREFAERGFASFRMDHSGIGDSVIHESRSRMSRKEREILEVQEAIACMEAAGVSEFLLVGICSGADLALKAGLVHPKVKGLFLINGRFVEPATHARIKPAVMRSAMNRFRGAKIFRLSNWLSKVKKLLGKGNSPRRRSLGRPGAPCGLANSGKDHEVWMSLAKSGIPTEIVFAERSANLDLFRIYHEKHFRKSAGKAGVGLRVIKGADHTFTPVASQERLKASMGRWCDGLGPALRNGR